MGKKMKVDLSINGIKKLQKEITNMEKKLQKYEGEHTIALPYSQQEWEKMTEYEKNEVIEEAKKNYIDNLKKDLFN